MSDFIGDLERELVAAARRRATRRRRVMPLPRLRPATVLAFVALVALAVALVAVVRELERGPQPAGEPPGPGVVVPLPGAEPARACPGYDQRVETGDVPRSQSFPLRVFTRPRARGDALPPSTGVPTGTIYPDGARRAGAEHFAADVHLVPIAEPREGGGCDGELQAQLGVCLVADAVVRCFSDEEVAAGRAVAVTSPGVVHGIAPDGVGRVTLHVGGETATADVHDNAYEISAPAAVGERVRLVLERTEECRPSPELLDALPVLRDGSWQALPAGTGVREWARRFATGEGLELWAVAHCDGVEHACVVALHAGQQVAEPCATADQLRLSETSWLFEVTGGRRAIAGMAPPGTRGVQVVGGGRVHDVAFAGGAYGGVLPPGVGLPQLEVKMLR
jgi:hypothetical protein